MSEAAPEVLYENLDGTGRRFETNTSLLIQGGDIRLGLGLGLGYGQGSRRKTQADAEEQVDEGVPG